jgi:hypothetical protein
MDEFIIVFFSMLIILLFTNHITYHDSKLEEDVILDFNNEKIKCKCDLKANSKDIKENFTNYKKNLKIEKPIINENIIISKIDDIKETKYRNITAQAYYQKKFKYPLEPIVINKYDVYPVNQYKYLNIGNDTDKLINI